MTTFIFIALVFFTTFILNTFIRNHYGTNSIKSNNKTSVIAKFGLLILVLGVVYINFSGSFDTKDETNANYNYEASDISAKSISEDFIKMDLRYPSTADFSAFDVSEELEGLNHIILRKVKAKNAFGVESEFVYKLTLRYTGGNEYDLSSWKLIKIQSEEYR